MWDLGLAAVIVVAAATVVTVYGEDDNGGDKDGPEIVVGIAVHHKKASLNSGGFGIPPFIAILCELQPMCEISRRYELRQNVRFGRKGLPFLRKFRCLPQGDSRK